MPISLDGKTAIVTSAGHDLGLAVARRFIESGGRVMLADCADKPGADVEQLIADGDGACHRFAYTAQDKLGIANLIAATADRFDTIDVLVNAAQAAGPPGRFLDIDTAAFDLTFGSNVRAPFQLSQAVARRMIQDREDEDAAAGVIVNVGSIAARRTVPGLIAFSVASAALDQLTRSMAISLAEFGIRVNGVAIGSVLTDRLKDALRENDELRDDMIRVTPLGRLADVEEAAETVMFLASDHASYVTGQIVSVDGGRTLLDPLTSPVR